MVIRHMLADVRSSILVIIKLEVGPETFLGI